MKHTGLNPFTGKLTKSFPFKKGGDIASTGDLPLQLNANFYHVTGTAQIDRIQITSWDDAELLILYFESAATLKHKKSASQDYGSISLDGSVDYVTSSGDVLAFIKDGNTWEELTRKQA